MALPYQTVDAFTETPFSGNPCAVILFDPADSRASDSTFLLDVAREFNYSESAFLVPLSSAPSPPSSVLTESTSAASTPTFSLRWFTPECEFPLCGHGTLAAAHTLFTSHLPSAWLLRFETLSGTLWARRMDGHAGIELDFPAEALESQEEMGQEKGRAVLEAAGSSCAEIKGKVVGWAKGRLGWVVELGASVDLPSLNIDAKSFLPLGGYIVFTQPAPPAAAEDIRSRVFDPVEVQQEDPVTGSAHCMLAPYWLGQAVPRSRLPAKLALAEEGALRARQVSARGGDLVAAWKREEGRVKLRGQAVTVMKGTLLL